MPMKKSEIVEIFSRFQENKENPRIELDHKNAYELLVAVILSAQATDKGVNRVTPNLFERANTPEQMVKFGLENLKEAVKSINYFNNKSANIIKMSQMLIDEFEGDVPDNMKDLMRLPGVGRKSANVMLNSIHGKHTIAVDTHVFRVSNRIGFCKTKTVEATEDALMKIVPKQFLDRAHHWLVLHGRYVCKARKPMCTHCLIDDICKFKDKKY